MTNPPQAAGDSARRRRTHKKSRGGCRNCKIRSVKCDETKPRCMTCTGFGVSCNYDGETPDLQLRFQGTTTIKTLQKEPPSSNQLTIRKVEVSASLTYPTIISDQDSTVVLDSQAMERLRRFQTRTVHSLGNGQVSHIFKDVAVELAYANPYFMHAVQTITAAHDRYLLSGTTPGPLSMPEIYHLSRAAALFNQKLSAPVQSQDRDSLWATAALLGTIAFTWIDASSAEAAWPLKPSEPSDLEWLRMSENKAAIWNLTDPLRADSCFHPLADEYRTNYFLAARVPAHGIAGLPGVFVRLYDLDDASTDGSSPYFAAVHVLTQLLVAECGQVNVVRFLGFVSHMRGGFKRLLERKDPRALLLLAYWYAKIAGATWWLEWRAVLECRAICLYLERFHPEETVVLDLLLFPKMRCGLLVG